MKNKILFWLLITFTLLNIIDSITTIFIIKGEANPIYHLFGNMYVVYALKILIILVLWWLYNINIYPSNFLYFTILTATMYGCLTLLLAQIINIYGILHPALIVQASKVSVNIRVKQYFQIASVIYLIPTFLTLVIFWLYDKSIHKVYICKGYNKIKGWWKFW